MSYASGPYGLRAVNFTICASQMNLSFLHRKCIDISYIPFKFKLMYGLGDNGTITEIQRMQVIQFRTADIQKFWDLAQLVGSR